MNKTTLIVAGMVIPLVLAVLFVTPAPAQETEDPKFNETIKNYTAGDGRKTNNESSARRFQLRYKPIKYEFDSDGLAKRRGTNEQNFDTDGPQQTSPDDEAQELAKKLSNPVASLISVPFQHNYDFGLGPNGDGFKYTLNFQPVIPVSLNAKWNMISRTIVPIVFQSKVAGTTSQFGLSDTIQTFFFSPNKTKPFIWAVGPQFLIPTGTSQYLGSQKFGMGPSFLVLQQTGPWTYGILATQMWSVFGKSTRAAVNSTFLQPFIAYTTKTAWTYNINAESTYDWTGRTWSVPIHFQVTKLIKMGKQRVSIGGALRCFAATTPQGPEGCGFRLLFTPLFPK